MEEAVEPRRDINELFDDFDHPNPNINKKAYLLMVRDWPELSFQRLIKYLNHQDIVIRRKSVKALSEFGFNIIPAVIQHYFSNEDIIIRISCLKILIRIAAKFPNRKFPKEVFDLIETAWLDDRPETILCVTSLLRQLRLQGLPYLIKASKDSNILRSKSAITAIGEIDDPSSEKSLRDLLENGSMDKLLWNSIADALNTQMNLKNNKSILTKD